MYYLAVAPALRRTGLGRRLVKAAGGPQGDEAVDITVADVAERAAQAGLAM
ncbi:GNAT family N-acetyltransferase [Oleomonas cavernae]|uniref:GNAT family N-acetyltransferase n=1 Tax=Oleomonas cavernae TaxID=2320859 RepID=UPI001314AE0C|nr:hypothetical protein [Oleomonas cavernae]